MASHRIQARTPRGTAVAADIERSPDAIARHLEDAAHYPGGSASGVARPRSEAEIAALLKSSKHVLPIGAQSSVTGGATPAGSLVLSTEHLRTLDDVTPAAVRAGAGLTIDELNQQLGAAGRWYPPFPTFTGATIGGIAATNAAGAATFKYGTTRRWVEGLTVVLACGCVLDLDRGNVIADEREGFIVDCAHGRRHVRPGTYAMPDVAKCSAGYFAAPRMDLVDLFVGAEGTLGIVTEVVLRVLPRRPAVAFVLVPVSSDDAALALVGTLRAASRQTWRTGDADGIDVAAVEMLDRRCLEMLREDGVDRRLNVATPADAAMVLLIQLELPPTLTPEQAFEQIAASGSESAAARGPLVAFCRVLRDAGVFDATEIALPGQRARAEQLLAFREAAPLAVNRRVGVARRDTDVRIEKTAADMIVPFDRLAEMLAFYRDGYVRRGLDFAIWGHLSDGNVHPNVIPRSFADVEAGRAAILEFGREAVRLGGSPLAEHGVGRSPMKQQLLRQLYGDRGLAEMRAIKDALDPDGRLAPGVLMTSGVTRA